MSTEQSAAETKATKLKQMSSQIGATLRSLPGMSEVDRVIRTKLSSDAELLVEIPEYLLEVGGKQLRPALCLLVSKAFGMEQPSSALIDVAAGIELIHMATLLHDDIIDQSPVRRHQEAPYKRFGIPSTLLAGDFLLVRAFSLCAQLDQFIIEETEKACVHLTEGEILETPLYSEQHSVESSLTIARKKTAALFRLAACSAAHLAEQSTEIVQKMAEFGESLGIAFQILDDILDVTSTLDLLGKATGTDLRERKPSIINVLWLESDTELSMQLLEEPTGNDEQYVAAAIQEILESDIPDQCRRLALSYTEKADQILDDLFKSEPERENAAVAALRGLIQFTVERVR